MGKNTISTINKDDVCIAYDRYVQNPTILNYWWLAEVIRNFIKNNKNHKFSTIFAKDCYISVGPNIEEIALKKIKYIQMTIWREEIKKYNNNKGSEEWKSFLDTKEGKDFIKKVENYFKNTTL